MRGYAELIPPKARCVVEFGCGGGNTGQVFKRVQPECRYIGVDQDERLLASARMWLDQTARSNFAALDFASHGIDAVDCFLYHGAFVDGPELGQKLREQAMLLPADGQMIFIWDNPGYFRQAMASWQGKPSLVQVRRTLPELLQLLEAAGMKIDRVLPQYPPEDETLKKQPEVQQLIAAFVAYCKSQHISVHTDQWARSFIVRAVKRMPERPRLLVQTLIGERRVTAAMRVCTPDMFSMTIPGVDCVERDRAVDLSIAPRYAHKVLIRQRIRVQGLEDIKSFRQILQLGYVLLYEMDDHPMLWQKSHEHSHHLDFVGSHAVQVSTPALAEYLRQYNPNVVVFQNQLRLLPEKRRYVDEGPVTLVFGALNRTRDWQDIMPVLNQVMAEYGERLRIRVMFDTKFFEALQTPYKEFVGREFPDGYVPYELYSQVLHEADIALLPLHDTAFNRTKSDLKFIESAGNGAVVLASPTVYAGSVRDGRNGFIYHNAREFREQLTMLVENRQRRIETAEAAYAYVKHNRLLSQHYEERVQYYESLIARLPELNRELEQRLAKLEALGNA